MHDAIVIGAGHNGLAAAVHLASKGWKVVVVEKSGEPGGAVKTRELTEPGFRHDIAAMNLSMFAGSQFFSAYRKDLIRNGLEFVPAPAAFASAFPGGGWMGVKAVSGLMAGGNCAVAQHDAVAWRALEQRFDREAPHVFGLLGARLPSWGAAKVVINAWRALGRTGLLSLLRLLLATPRDFLDENFDDPRLKAMLAAWALHLDFAPDTAGGALFPYLEAMAGQRFGMMLGKGGADTIIAAMTSLLKERGGELILGTEALRIETSQGKASTVHLADGRVLRSRRAVIANIHPKLVFGKLLGGSGNSAYDRDVARFRTAPGGMMIHLALQQRLEWIAGEDLSEFAYVHLAPDMTMMARAYAEAAAGLLPVEPAIVVGQPTAFDPSRAPKDHHVLWVQVRFVPGGIVDDAAGQIDSRDWNNVKDAYADRVIDIIERYAPNIRGAIMSRAVLSPLDLERENPSLFGGDSLGGSHRLDQNFILRPVGGWSGYRTPIKNLYLCGASTWPGAGTGAGSGFGLGRMLAR